MRNALVHDYPNLDREVIIALIKQQTYKDLISFADQGLVELGKI